MPALHTILIIEDNDDIRENLSEILELSGYKAISAENGGLGIEKAFEEKPDCIICDIAMPVKNGYEVFARLKSFCKDNAIPFIFLSASAQERDLIKGKAAGVDAYITKPFDDEKLLQQIVDLLDR
ncbi:response regulator [bacterium]|nr:response regulator [bacterium]